jgi:hypothetical protein
VHFAAKVPSVPVERRMNLGRLMHARLTSPSRPSWCAIFTKAYALVAAARPELRRAYLTFPRTCLYEHPINVASIAIERDVDGEPGVFFVHVKEPDKLSLNDLELLLMRNKEAPIENVSSFRRALFLSRLPQPLRRFAWWFGLNVIGRKRAHYFGTFGVSVYSGLGAASLHPLSPLTTTLNYGVIDASGMVDVRLVYDHRVLDGATVARALNELEEALTSAIASELRRVPASQAA